MKKLLLAFSSLAAIVLVSCSKEKSNENGGSGGGSSNQLLSKVVTKTGSDSTVQSFGYNSSGKLTSLNTTGISGGSALAIQEKFVRNSSGIVTQVITRDPDLAQYGIDSLITNVRYNTTNGRYTNRVTELNLLGGALVIRDSSTLTYDGSGKVIMETDYIDDGSGSGYEPSSKTEYTYTGTNMMTIKSSSYDTNSGSFSEDYTTTQTYDAKVSPLVLGNEAFAIAYPEFYSSNNVINSVLVNPTDPSQNATTATTLTYNSANKPLSGVTNVQGGQSGTVTYFY
jgi:hypothetical protein